MVCCTRKQKFKMKEKDMKIVFHESFYSVYASDPAADHGRMESIMGVLEPSVEAVQAIVATADRIRAVPADSHLKRVSAQGIYDAAALAAGGAVQSATIGLEEPCMGVIQPPGITPPLTPPGVSAISTTWPLPFNL
jgi:hypothetical protein